MERLTQVRWAHLRPDDFVDRQSRCPVVYLPFGLCEPHGHIAPFGLDTLKADYYCEEAAARFGGIVAPTQGYHIHECGSHRPWLDEVVGVDQNPYLGAMPPYVVCFHFLYQLRAFANAGFRAVIGVSGHHGGSQRDLRRVASVFTDTTGIPVTVKTDPEWVEGLYANDHAGKYEISQLLDIYPESIELEKLNRQHEPGSGGRLALNPDAGEATAAYGKEINEAILAAIGDHLAALQLGPPRETPLTYDATEDMWNTITASDGEWFSMR